VKGTINYGSIVMRSRRCDWKTGCSVEAALSVLGGLWKPVVLFHLLEGKRRFGELSRLVPNATQRMLTLQLRELEADGVINRIVFPEVPPKVEYSLTEFGKTVEPVLFTLRDWGEEYQAGRGPSAKSRRVRQATRSKTTAPGHKHWSRTIRCDHRERLFTTGVAAVDEALHVGRAMFCSGWWTKELRGYICHLCFSCGLRSAEIVRRSGSRDKHFAKFTPLGIIVGVPQYQLDRPCEPLIGLTQKNHSIVTVFLELLAKIIYKPIECCGLEMIRFYYANRRIKVIDCVYLAQFQANSSIASGYITRPQYF
jgi:DNA-binding HxlR family transcriptional regulator